jgi:hypothetical protein
MYLGCKLLQPKEQQESMYAVVILLKDLDT